MPARLSCLTLPVDDLQASIAFYRDGLGLEYESLQSPALFMLSDQVMLMVLPREEFTGFAQMAGQEAAARGSSEMIMTCFATSVDEVDEVLERAVDYGSNGEAAEQRPWGYSGYVSDPDGHVWEVLYNPILNGETVEDEPTRTQPVEEEQEWMLGGDFYDEGFEDDDETSFDLIDIPLP